MTKNNLIFFLIILCLLIIIIIIINQLHNSKCEPFATTTKSSLTTLNKQIHLTATSTNLLLIGDASKLTPIASSNIIYQKSPTNSKYVMVFPPNKFGQIKLEREKWTATNDFNKGMTIFAVLQPTNISNASTPDYPFTGLINIPKKYYANLQYYAGPLLLYNVTYCFGNGTDRYNCSVITGGPCFWSGHNNNTSNMLQLYTLIITPTDGKMKVKEYINGNLILDGTYDIFSDTNTTNPLALYAPIYIGMCNLGNDMNVYIGTLAELVIYNRGLSNADINTNWDYLCSTWKIPQVKKL